MKRIASSLVLLAGLVGGSLHCFAGAEYVHPSLEQRLALFAGLKKQIEELHTFSPITERNLNFVWRDHLAEYEQWFRAAQDRNGLLAALHKMNKSLHDGHCMFWEAAPPAEPWHELGLGIAYEAGAAGGRYYVEQVDPSLERKSGVRPGDTLLAADGLPPAELEMIFFNFSNASRMDLIRQDVADLLTHRRPGLHPLPPDKRSRFTFQSAADGHKYQRVLRWLPQKKGGQGGELSYEVGECYDLPKAEYGHGYRREEWGINFCVYRSPQPDYQSYLIIRFFSFNYGGGADWRDEIFDYNRLKSALAGDRFQGIVLDVRGNHGGIDGNDFIEWFNDRSYLDNFVRMRLHPYLADRQILEQCMMRGAKTDWYLSQLKKHKGKTLSDLRPFICKNENCAWDNRYAPRRRLSRLPVAILGDSDCGSTCAHFVYLMKERGFAPVVGERTMGNYTSHRLPLPVQNPADGSKLGDFLVAVSMDYDGQTKEPIEGYAPAPDLELKKTSANFKDYDRLLLEGAVGLLKKKN
jgi:hypothetical protein